MTSSRLALASLAAAAMCATLAAPVSAQEIKQLGTYKAWTAWTGADSSGAMCYISAQPEDWSPKEVNGAPVRRSPIHFLIINRKGLGTKNEVQTQVGYPFAANAGVVATIDGRSFPMVTEGEAAWLAVEADEPGFVEALKAGSKLVVTGTSLKGNKMTDNYNLSGVTAALGEIAKACA
ncbi:invasion associated locus B family protein [Devosia sp. ZB163]|uniref:invasion associated locus B family protein n=1 Tax=Devosia sp. ZB163 TaxID=3025938 RepID=UPI0023602FB7|nr:invasion associated locus B family protein [Devosia sp. ZB163]MDC9822359.1 invasion associated locus B family protein [Devosia sp. ZB163]